MSVEPDPAAATHGLIRQGDVLLIPVEGVPGTARVVGTGRLVLAHGEATGHAHVVDDERASLHRVGGVGPTRFLRVVGDEPVFLVHDEHDRLAVRPGVYEVRRQREYAPRQRSAWVRD